MSARSGAWSLLGHDRDPVSGSPEEVQRLADGYASTARDIDRLANQLRRLSNLEDWTGDAAQVFGEAAEDLSDDLRDAERRYRELADAVRGWVGPLTTARDESAGALRQAERAEEQRRLNDTDGLANVAEPTPEQVTADQQRQDRVAAAEADRAAARGRLENALAELETAANRTADKIRAAGEHGADRWWNDFGGFVRSIGDVLTVIAKVLEILAIVLIVVGLLFTGTWVLVLAATASVLLLGVHTAMVASGVPGATWTDVVMDLIGVLTLGFGAVLGRAAARGLAALRPRVASHVDDAARTFREGLERARPNFIRSQNAQHMANPRAGLRTWGRQYIDDAMQRASDAGAREAQRVTSDLVTDAPWRNRLGALDRGLAQDLLASQRLGREQLDYALRTELAGLTNQMQRAQAANLIGGGLAGTSFGLDTAGVDWKQPVDDFAFRSAWRLTQQ